MTFQDLFPHLHRWVELDGKVEIGYDSMGYSDTFLQQTPTHHFYVK